MSKALEAGLTRWESGSKVITDPADQINRSGKIIKGLECWDAGFGLVFGAMGS